MIYQVFNPLTGQYFETETIEKAKELRQKIINEYVIAQGIGLSLITNEFLPYDSAWLSEMDMTEQEYNENPFPKYKSYEDCTSSEKAQLDAKKQEFIQNNSDLFVVNEATINENTDAIWTVLDTSNW